MTPEEYKSRFEVLKKQELELARMFIKNNPFKKFKGKIVNLTIGCRTERVLFDGVEIEKDFLGRPCQPALFYYRLKKDGKPRKNIDCIPIYLYKGNFKIEKV